MQILESECIFEELGSGSKARAKRFIEAPYFFYSEVGLLESAKTDASLGQENRSLDYWILCLFSMGS